jgi:hypothetical protein
MSNDVKIFFNHDAFDDVGLEGIWAKKDGDSYIIDNIPFYTKNYALGDIISVKEEMGVLYAQSVLQESGNSVVRVLFSDENAVQQNRDRLKKMGCASELSNLPNLIAVDIPKNVNYLDVISFLDIGEKNGDWEYQEACISSFHRAHPR